MHRIAAGTTTQQGRRIAELRSQTSARSARTSQANWASGSAFSAGPQGIDEAWRAAQAALAGKLVKAGSEQRSDEKKAGNGRQNRCGWLRLASRMRSPQMPKSSRRPRPERVGPEVGPAQAEPGSRTVEVMRRTSAGRSGGPGQRRAVAWLFPPEKRGNAHSTVLSAAGSRRGAKFSPAATRLPGAGTTGSCR